jgi:hypothetical protein
MLALTCCWISTSRCVLGSCKRQHNHIRVITELLLKHVRQNSGRLHACCGSTTISGLALNCFGSTAYCCLLACRAAVQHHVGRPSAYMMLHRCFACKEAAVRATGSHAFVPVQQLLLDPAAVHIAPAAVQMACCHDASAQPGRIVLQCR